MYFIHIKHKIPNRGLNIIKIFLVDITKTYSNDFVKWCIDWEKVVLALIENFKPEHSLSYIQSNVKDSKHTQGVI